MRSRIFRILRVAALVLALLFAGKWLLRNFTTVRSEQAVINAEILQLRSPIEGVLDMGQIRPGQLLKKGDLVFKMVNPRFGDRESVAQYNALQNLLESVRSDLLGAHHSEQMAQLEYDRATRLYSRKLISREETEQATARLAIAKSLVADRTKLLERSTERAKEMSKQMELQKASEVRMPEAGLVWSIAGKTGEQLESNKLVVEVINPERMWVEAFFSERQAAKLKTGLPAAIRSLDSESVWRGTLQSVRAGVGRMSYDTTVAVPPPELAKRQMGVRVETDWDHPFSPSEFYGVGRSVEVVVEANGETMTLADRLMNPSAPALQVPRSSHAVTLTAP